MTLTKEVFTYLFKGPLKRDHLSFLYWLILLLLKNLTIFVLCVYLVNILGELETGQ